ncbi:MAG: hypothetical protein H8E25_00805 [Planctomycetes bacterium]|jgi:hypothetical protein|nr:hypothetical protein [Planctomycetota bacterium]MDB2682004.1 hypothetical protein [Opitutales bacterium]
MKIRTITSFLLITATLSAIATTSPTPVEIVFNFTNSTINGNNTLGTNFRNDVDGQTAAIIHLNTIVAGLTLTVTASQSDISNTANGLGITSGGTLNTFGDALQFSFNQMITLDSLKMGDFTGTGQLGEDIVSILYSNTNPSITLSDEDFDDKISNTIVFSSDNSLAPNQLFTIRREDGDFAIEGFGVTIVPENNQYVLLSSLFVLSFSILRRRKI